MQQIQAFIDVVGGIVNIFDAFVVFFAVAQAYGLHTGFFRKFQIGVAVVDKQAFFRRDLCRFAEFDVNIGVVVLFIFTEFFHRIKTAGEKVV